SNPVLQEIFVSGFSNLGGLLADTNNFEAARCFGQPFDGVINSDMSLRCEQNPLMRVACKELEYEFRNKRGLACPRRAMEHKEILSGKRALDRLLLVGVN